LSGRSRKRGRRERVRAQPATPVNANPSANAGASSSPSSSPSPSPTRAARSAAQAETNLQRGYRRGEERNEAIRAALEPLAPGERPWPLRVAVGLALLIAIGNIAQVIFGSRVKFGAAHTSVVGVAAFSLIMLVCAIGMWRKRYWALLGFEALLALVIVLFCFVLVTSVDVARALIALVVIGAGGYLFFKLVRVLSRMQMPQPRRGG
jgi:hypothetical protein